jgi:hypothetical protein
VLLFGTHINQDLKFGFSYDLPISKVSEVGSFEFMLGYCFKLDYNKVAKGFKNPRFFIKVLYLCKFNLIIILY